MVTYQTEGYLAPGGVLPPPRARSPRFSWKKTSYKTDRSISHTIRQHHLFQLAMTRGPKDRKERQVRVVQRVRSKVSAAHAALRPWGGRRLCRGLGYARLHNWSCFARIDVSGACAYLRSRSPGR
ncbi:unnamed protein product [Pieris brassicae]|uniref:Uncharacterized protein n=1 Tax=Pieris brassicae TaxID=7116 RepID=A0A9P0SWL4_PIEBR|nr:unnamed protein product [Pieris brassicae]